MSLRRRALFFAGLFVAVSCSDAGNPLEPNPEPLPEPEEALQTLDCSVSVTGANFRCEPAQPDAGGALAAGFTNVGMQGVYVELARVSAQNLGTDTLEIGVTIKNLIPQPLGTEDGVTEDPYGVRVFFVEPPVTNPGGLLAEVANEDGTARFTAANQPYFEYDTIIKTDSVTAPRHWKLKFDPSVGPSGTIFFRVLLRTKVQYEKGWVDVTPQLDTIGVDSTTQLSAVVRNRFGTPTGQGVTWTSRDPGVASVDGDGLVTGEALGSVYIVATPTGGRAPDSALIVVNSPVVANTDSVDAVGNVTVSYPSSIGLLVNDTDADAPAQTLSVVPGTVPTAEGGTAVLAADGSFTYISFPGFIGKDTIPYTVQDSGGDQDQGVAIVNVGQRYWYLQPTAASNGTGRSDSPFNSLFSVDSASAGSEPILVRGGTGEPKDSSSVLTLKTGQPLIGEGIPADLTTTLMGGAVTVTLLEGTGASPKIIAKSGATLTLGQNNTLRGVHVASGAGAAVTGSNFGTLTLADQVLLNAAGGPALQLSTGDLNSASVFSLSSSGSATTGLSLTNVTGSLAATGGSISGSTGAAVAVSGQTASLTYGGSVTKSGAGELLSVSNSHSGTLTFNGTLTGTGGSGLVFNDADGSYNFNGTTSLSGGPRVDISNNSTGDFFFGADAEITNATGTAVSVNGAGPSVIYRGDITQNTQNQLLVAVMSQAVGDSAIFETGTLSAANGEGILLSDADGIVRFKGSTTLDGGDAGVDVISGSTGTVDFNATTIENVTGTGLEVFESAPTLTFAGSITTTVGSPVVVDGASPCGTISVSATINASGQGILVQDCSAGSVSFTGAKTLSTGANAAVTLTNNNGGSVSLTGGALSITTSTGTGILGNGAGGFGSLTVGNATINATNGPALNLTNGTLNATFGSLTSGNSATNGVSLASVNGTLNTSGGTISGATGTAFHVSGGSVAGAIGTAVSQGNNASTLVIAGGHTTGTDSLTFSGNVTATNGNGIQFTDADGNYTFTGTFNLDGSGDEGIDIAAVSNGVIHVIPAGANTAAITSPTGIAIQILGGGADLLYRGNITQASNAALLSVSGGHNGDLAFPSGTLTASNGTGLQFDNADGTYTFGGTVNLSNTVPGGDAGIDVTNNSTGTFSFPTAASITNPGTGNAISILNSAPSFTYSGGVTKTNNSVTAILISGNTGGTITFNGDATSADGDPADVARTINTGTAHGVSLVSNNAATTVSFNGGGLSITTTSGIGFNATSGTVNITGAGNAISSGTGAALVVQNATIGLSGLSFASISHSGGVNGNGIVLENTGALNGMQVTGTGNVAGSGGTITNTQGADGSTQGAGIYLNNTRAISLAFMALSGHANWAIRGNNVVGFTMNKVRITGTNGTSTTTDDGSVYFTELTGSASITGSFIDGGFEDGVLVDNTTGTLNRITFDGDTIGSASGISGDGLRLEASGSAVLNATIQNTRFARAAGDMFQHNIIGNAQSDLDFLNNTLINSHPTISGGGGGVTITAAESGDLTYDIDGNTFRGAKGVALLVNKPFGGSPGNGTMSGHIRNNVVGTAGATQNGSSEGSGIQVGLLAQGTHTTLIQNNQVYDYANFGIFVNMGGTAQSVTGLTHNGTMNATVLANTVAEPTAPAGGFAQNGFHVNAGSNDPDAYQMCVDFGHASNAASRNTINGSGALGGTDFRMRHRFDAVMRMPGYTGGVSDNAAVVTYIQNRNNNSGSTTGTASNQVTLATDGFFNTSPAGSACPQP